MREEGRGVMEARGGGPIRWHNDWHGDKISGGFGGHLKVSIRVDSNVNRRVVFVLHLQHLLHIIWDGVHQEWGHRGVGRHQEWGAVLVVQNRLEPLMVRVGSTTLHQWYRRGRRRGTGGVWHCCEDSTWWWGGWVIQCLRDLLSKNLYLRTECRYLGWTVAMRLLGGCSCPWGWHGTHRRGPGRWWGGIFCCWFVRGVEAIEESHLRGNVQKHVVLVHTNQFRDYPAICQEGCSWVERGFEEVEDGHKPSDSLVGVTWAVNRDCQDSQSSASPEASSEHPGPRRWVGFDVAEDPCGDRGGEENGVHENLRYIVEATADLWDRNITAAHCRAAVAVMSGGGGRFPTGRWWWYRFKRHFQLQLVDPLTLPLGLHYKGKLVTASPLQVISSDSENDDAYWQLICQCKVWYPDSNCAFFIGLVSTDRHCCIHKALMDTCYQFVPLLLTIIWSYNHLFSFHTATHLYPTDFCLMWPLAFISQTFISHTFI